MILYKIKKKFMRIQKVSLILNKRLKSQFNETKEDLFDFGNSFGYENPKISDDCMMVQFTPDTL